MKKNFYVHTSGVLCFFFFIEHRSKRIVWDFPQWKVIILNQFQSQIAVIFLVFQHSHWTEITCLSHIITFYQDTTSHVPHVPEIHSSSKARQIGNISQFFQPRNIKV